MSCWSFSTGHARQVFRPARSAAPSNAPNRKWIADFTYVWTAEGWFYVAAVIDLFSRRVVGWSMNAAMTT
jgi:transposase InsO family protein